MTRWTRYDHDQGRRLIWLDESSAKARAVAVDVAGVHPRLDVRDHQARELAVLSDRVAVEEYIAARAVDPGAAAVLRSAAALHPHLQALWGAAPTEEDQAS